MDFRIKKRRAGHGGLNMGLCPGTYQGAKSHDDAIQIAEDSFWFLEPGIRKHCSRYAGDAHWGVTAISRDERLQILAEWEQLRAELATASMTTDLAILRLVMKDTRKLFVRDFMRNRLKLSKMIGELIVWIRMELIGHDHVSILGI